MNLSIETLRDNFDNLNAEGQRSFLRLCGDAQRLRRVIEASKQFLQADSEGYKFVGKKIAIESINEFARNILSQSGVEAHFEPLADDISVSSDPYWISVCVDNLLRNANLHGEPPITLKILHTNDLLSIIVEDRGRLPENANTELLKPFYKKDSSTGLGLGLAIVSKISKGIGAELKIKQAPTRFILELKT